MDKKEFLKKLDTALEKNDISEARRKRVVKTFESKIDAVPVEESEALMASFGNPEKIAAEYKRMLDERKAQKEEACAEGSADNVSSTQAQPPLSNELKESDGKNSQKRSAVFSGRGQIIFYSGVVLLSPILLALSLLVLALFALLYAAVFALDALLTVGLIIGGIVSIIFSLGGILYGIVGLLPGGVESYVGMYELGIGIMIVGIMIVVSILVYHFVIKVTPILIKLITVFEKFASKQIFRFVKFVKKECDKL